MTSLWTVVLVAVAGGVGSVLRYLVDHAVPTELRSRYPWGTTIVNVTGSFALGLLVGTVPAAAWARVIGVGLLGGYTTFSTASLDTVDLLEARRVRAAVANGLGLLIACVVAAVVGVLTGNLLR